MKEIVFETNVPVEDIEKNFDGFNVYDGLMESLAEALAFKKGDASAKTFTRKRALPDVNVAELRKSLNMT